LFYQAQKLKKAGKPIDFRIHEKAAEAFGKERFEAAGLDAAAAEKAAYESQKRILGYIMRGEDVIKNPFKSIPNDIRIFAENMAIADRNKKAIEGAAKREKEIAKRTATATAADKELQAGNLSRLAEKGEFKGKSSQEIEKILLERVSAASDASGATGVVPSFTNPEAQALMQEVIRKQKEKALEELVSDADDEAPTQPIVEQEEVATEEAEKAAKSFAVGDFQPYKEGGKMGYKIKSLNPDGTIKDYIYVNDKGQDTSVTLTPGMIGDANELFGVTK
jgi:hypothetical protein